MTDKNTAIKEEYFNTLFETRVTRYGKSIDSKTLETKLICNNQALDSMFNKLFSDYKVKHSWNDYYSECMYWAWMAIMRFEIKDEGSWEEIIAGTDKPNTGRLITSIKTTVKHEIYRFVNDGAKFTRGEVDGVKGQHVTLKFDIGSLDALLSSDSEGGTVVDLISEEQNFFSTINLAEYQISYFTKWFRENKEDFLEPSQLIFLNQLEKIRKVEGYTVNDTESALGMTNSAANSRMRRIKNRIATTYLKENLNGAQNRLQMTIADEMELWAPVIDLVESEDLLNQNDQISDWILQNIETPKVANMLYDNLNHEQSIELTTQTRKAVGGQLPNSILYKFIDEVEKRIEDLKNTDTTITPITAEVNQQEKAYKAKKKAWANKPIIVTDLKGNFLREEKPVHKKPKLNIQYVLSTGVRCPI